MAAKDARPPDSIRDIVDAGLCAQCGITSL